MPKGYTKAHIDPDVLDAYPALELIFIYKEFPAEKRTKWLDKWTEAGGRLFGGRPIALKNDPVWRRISYKRSGMPPYDRTGAVDARDINREEAEQLGLLRPDEELDQAAFSSDAPETLTRPLHRR